MNGGSIPVCTVRKATGKCVLECFLSSKMYLYAYATSTFCHNWSILIVLNELHLCYKNRSQDGNLYDSVKTLLEERSEDSEMIDNCGSVLSSLKVLSGLM